MAPSRLDYLADFDSASAMLRALANFLRSRDFPNLGLTSALRPVAIGTNLLPRTLRQEVYKLGGYFEAVAPDTLERVKDEDIAGWVVDQYPARRYPAVLVGSSNGALTHLAAALGAPWLPQTFLIPVHQRGVEVDEPKHALDFGREPGRRLLDANPNLQLHHMHDANQDRLMTHYMTYFRIKRRRLGEAYARFLTECLEPGGIIILVECRHSWPTTRVGPRHVFQMGGSGGISPEEYLYGGPRVERWFAEHGVKRKRWDSPQPDGKSPEAEWGFEETLRADVERFANGHGHRVVRIVFDEPEDPSPLVADLYRWWYRTRGIPANRLLVDSFILMDPWWALRLGAVPFWMKFNTEVSAAALERYLDDAEPYDEIHLMLFAHGVASIGLTPIERWRALLARAKQRGCFLGVDEKAYPADFAVFARYHPALRKIPGRYQLPAPLAWVQFEDFIRESGADRRTGVTIRDGPGTCSCSAEPGAAVWNSAAASSLPVARAERMREPRRIGQCLESRLPCWAARLASPCSPAVPTWRIRSRTSWGPETTSRAPWPSNAMRTGISPRACPAIATKPASTSATKPTSWISRTARMATASTATTMVWN